MELPARVTATAARADPPAGWRERARDLARTTLAPLVEEEERAGRTPPAVLTALRAGGFFGLGIPERWGGVGGTAGDICAVLEELARESAATATLLSVHLSVAAAPILAWGTDGQREEHLRPLAEGRALGAFALTEPGVGSDAAHLSCRYRREADGFVLSGSKMFITNGAQADLLVAFATRDPSLGHPGISAFLVRHGAPGFTASPPLSKLGLRGSETCELSFTDVRLGPTALLGAEGDGLRIALGALAGGRVGIASCALGVAQGAFDTLTAAARSAPEDWKRVAVARAFTEVSAARALVTEAARLKDAGADFVAAASAAKLFASEAAVRIAYRAVDVAGPAGARAGARAERLLRDARVFPIVEGTTEIQQLILGRSLVGR